jgi:sodium/potassium-transporting ATPase subunit alpha
VPADCRVVFNQGMKIDQSMITGESEPVDSQVTNAHMNSLEAKNIIFNGSLVVEGTSLAVAIRTGDATLIGSMVELTGDVGASQSTLKADIEYFVKLLVFFAFLQVYNATSLHLAHYGLLHLRLHTGRIDLHRWTVPWN